MELFPSRAVLRHLTLRGESWRAVVEDLEHPECNLPVPGYSTRRAIHGIAFTGYVEPWDGDGDDAWLVVGVREREKAPESEASGVVGQEVARSLPRSHGGCGTRWPTSWRELTQRLEEIKSVTIERGSKHIVIYKDGKQIDALPCSASDHRALANTALHLKRLGIDVSR